jgi:hypothetical protein
MAARRRPAGARILRAAALSSALALLLQAALVAPASAAPPVTNPQRAISIGFMAGEPTGGTMRMVSPIHATHAWEMGLGWSFAGEDGLQFHAQHQWHLFEFSRSDRGVSTFYIGAGGRVKQVEGTRLGVRGSVGVNFLAGRKARAWESFFELAPTLDLTPDNHTWLNAMVGVRWFIPGATGR